LELHFVLNPQFSEELGKAEADKRKQDALLQQIERAAEGRIVRHRATGAGFVVVAWRGCYWMAWYDTDGAVVDLRSIRRDLR
jgi:hypothetical protein